MLLGICSSSLISVTLNLKDPGIVLNFREPLLEALRNSIMSASALFSGS